MKKPASTNSLKRPLRPGNAMVASDRATATFFRAAGKHLALIRQAMANWIFKRQGGKDESSGGGLQHRIRLHSVDETESLALLPHGVGKASLMMLHARVLRRHRDLSKTVEDVRTSILCSGLHQPASEN